MIFAYRLGFSLAGSPLMNFIRQFHCRSTNDIIDAANDMIPYGRAAKKG
jgi:hypothetical protein